MCLYRLIQNLVHVHDFDCDWLDSSIDFDKRHEATDTVAEIEDELQDIQRSLKDIKDDKTEFLENQSWRNSIRVDGIPDNLNDKRPGQVQKWKWNIS